jgi:PII-like signaling protein
MTMELTGTAKRARIYIGESDQWQGMPLYSAIVREAKQAGLAGATVLRGIEGFGAASAIHTARILRLSEDLPILIELVDTPERLDAFLPTLLSMVGGGLVTVDTVEVLHYHHEGAG